MDLRRCDRHGCNYEAAADSSKGWYSINNRHYCGDVCLAQELVGYLFTEDALDLIDVAVTSQRTRVREDHERYTVVIAQRQAELRRRGDA